MNEIVFAIITDVKSAITSSKSVKFDNGCILESKFGKITIDLSKYEKVSHVVLHVKRVSGNGKVSINEKDYVITSKVLQDVELVDTKIEMSTAGGVGEINLFAISLYRNQLEEEQGDTLALNWKKLINKCGDYRCLRMVGDRLFASEGAYLTNGTIIQKIETNPPGVTKMESDGKLVFISSCEVTELVVDGASPLTSNTTNIYTPRNPPTLISVPAPVDISLPQIPSGDNIIKKNHDVKIYQPTQHFVYDSTTVNEFSTLNKKNSKNTKFVKSNGNEYLVLQRGSYEIQLPSLSDTNAQYAVIISAKKLNGNGKLYAAFTMTQNKEDITLDGILREHSFLVNREDIAVGPCQSLQLSTGPNGHGEILISRVRILKMSGTIPISSLNKMNELMEMEPVTLRPETRKFVIVIPSYKNAQWCKKNIESTINQNYDSYRVIFTDDDSPDGTFDIVKSIVDASPKKDKFTVIKNTQRVGALANLYNMIHSCDDDEIILTLDGDDWLAHDNVLTKLNEVYYSGEVWMTYGQYQNHPDGGRGVAQQIPDSVIQSKSYRSFTWCSTHLRTFYAWLFKNIRTEDLMYQGNFMSMTWDMAMMFPMLEMSGARSRFISDYLYTYNLENPINDHKVNVQLQQNLDRYVRNLPTYSVLTHPKTLRHKLSGGRPVKVGLMIIATGKYSSFIQGLITSADSYFLSDKNSHVTYYVFTDQDVKLISRRNVVPINIPHRPFPYASMDRFKHFTNYSDVLQSQEYLYYVDVDCLFVNYVSREILGDLVGVRHCGYYRSIGPYEPNPKSCFYVDGSYPKKYRYYFGGGFSGGRSDKYLEMSKKLSEMIDEDTNNGIIPMWHDETALNRYFLDNEPEVVLDPSYHYPQDNIERYNRLWAPDIFRPKILLLTKNHNAMR